jgi:hypothetical protein
MAQVGEWRLWMTIVMPFVGLQSTPLAPPMPGPRDFCCSCGACGLMVAALVAIPLVLVAMNAGFTYRVHRDAVAREAKHRTLWLALVLISGPFGWLVYYFSRPKGLLVPCPGCTQGRLEGSARCPHCGHS